MAPTARVLAGADVIVISSLHVSPIAAQIAAAGCADRILADNDVIEQMADGIRLGQCEPASA
jgi:hypothetical protein